MRGEAVELVARHDAAGDDDRRTSGCWATRSRGDASLFTRDDSVEAAWRVVDRSSAQARPPARAQYEAGDAGVPPPAGCRRDARDSRRRTAAHDPQGPRCQEEA